MRTKLFGLVASFALLPYCSFAQYKNMSEAEYNAVAECAGILDFMASQKSAEEKKRSKDVIYKDALFRLMMKNRSAIIALNKFNAAKAAAPALLQALSDKDRDRKKQDCVAMGAKVLDNAWEI
jgi:hypothetical protein